MMTLELLEATSLLKGFGQVELRKIVPLFQEQKISAGLTIFAEKAPAESLYIVKSGRVKILATLGSGAEVDLLSLEPGSFFGELALVCEDTRMVTARAETDIELLRLSRSQFNRLLDQEPLIGSHMLLVITKLLATRVRGYGDQLKEMLAREQKPE